MRRPSRRARKWQEFNRKHGLRIFLIIAAIAVMALVALLLYAMTTPVLRPHL